MFINAWDPDTLFDPSVVSLWNPSGLSTKLGANDIYLMESFQITRGEYRPPLLWIEKSEKALRYSHVFGTRIATVTREDGQFDQAKFDYAWFSTLLYGFDFMSWGEPGFSANAQLPFHARRDLGKLGDFFSPEVTHSRGGNSGVHSRAVSGGTIRVDTNTHTGQFLRTAAHWRFDELTGSSAEDLSGNNNLGAILGATHTESTIPWLGSLRNLSALEFSNRDNYVKINADNQTNLHLFENGITLEAIISPTSLPINADGEGDRLNYIIWGDDATYQLVLRSIVDPNNPNAFITELVSAVSCGSTDIGVAGVNLRAPFNNNLVGLFSHVAMTFADGVMRLYINGHQVAETTSNTCAGSQVGPIHGREDQVRIGIDETASGSNRHDRNFRGIIDEVRITEALLFPSEFLLIGSALSP